jgi:hypothetical protein
MTIDVDAELPDDVPVPDAVEQQQPAADADDEGGLDRGLLAEPLDHDANPADLVDQAIIVPLPDDDRDTDEV